MLLPIACCVYTASVEADQATRHSNHHAGELAAAVQHAAVATGEAFDDEEVGLHRAHNFAGRQAAVHGVAMGPYGQGPWRSRWDSNPRYGITVHRISSPAHSTTLPPLLNSVRVVRRPVLYPS